MSSGHNGRRQPNVSQYLANLNTVPTQHELAAQQTDMGLGDDDLDFLTNAEFFDFDQFGPNAAAAAAYDPQRQQQQRGGLPFQFSPVQHQAGGGHAANPISTPTSLESQSPTQTLHGIYPPQPHHVMPQPSSGGSSGSDKRRGSVPLSFVADLEEASRMAAEEDKRRRNTAASARFRVKKKQREQALENQAKEMADKVQQLEGKVQQLEMENKWLKELITEKSDVKTLEAALELSSATSSITSKKLTGERRTEQRTDGVGTAPNGLAGA